MSEDVERIAAGLTEAQRVALFGDLALSPEKFGLAKMGLVWKMADHFDLVTGGVLKGGWQLRRKGLQVRAILEETP